MIGQASTRVTLDVPNGSGGYLPLDPPDWYCAILQDSSGQATLIGRVHPGITPNTRVHLGARVFHVTSIAGRVGRDELVLTCAEVFE